MFYFRINSAGPKETIELSQVTGKEKQTVDNFTLSFFYISPKGNISFLEHTVFTLQYSRRHFFVTSLHYVHKYCTLEQCIVGHSYLGSEL